MDPSTTSTGTEGGDLVGRGFWDANWTGSKRRRFRPTNYYHRDLDKFIRSHLSVGGRFLELGCAESIWINRFAAVAEVWGLDYSPTGIARLRDHVGQSGARLIVGDLFDAENGVPRGYFDLVFSEGLLEHFSDARTTVEAFASYLRPGGTLLTSVPNMHGLIGRLHRLVFREFYEAHIRYKPALLDGVHADAGLQPIEPARYWGHVSFGVLNYRQLFRHVPIWVANMTFMGLLITQQLAAWTAHLFRIPENPFISPHIRGAYRKVPSAQNEGITGR